MRSLSIRYFYYKRVISRNKSYQHINVRRNEFGLVKQIQMWAPDHLAHMAFRNPAGAFSYFTRCIMLWIYIGCVSISNPTLCA